MFTSATEYPGISRVERSYELCTLPTKATSYTQGQSLRQALVERINQKRTAGVPGQLQLRLTDKGGGGVLAYFGIEIGISGVDLPGTQAEDTCLRRAQSEYAIAVLVGQEASGFTLSARADETFAMLPAVAPGVPSQLLERRPDVAAAERRVAAANAGIGVARAAYFPVLSLSGTAGGQSSTTSSLLSAPAQYWSLGPQALLTVFDAGAHAAQAAAAHASYDEQVANYRSTVLTAFQEVEDNLAALRQLQLESISQAAAVTATQGASSRRTCATKAGSSPILRSCRRRTRRSRRGWRRRISKSAGQAPPCCC
jgi:outer membrane efflux protein